MPLKAKKIDWGPEIPSHEPKREGRSDWLRGFPNLYERIQEAREDEWRKLVKAFEANPDSVFNAYSYVAYHPMFYSWKVWPGHADRGIPPVHEMHLVNERGWDFVHLDPHMVDPATGRISDDVHLNTKVEWWYEYGPTLYQHMDGKSPGISGHDWKRDGGAETCDEGIVKVAKSIHRHYGNDRRKVQEIWNDPELPNLPEVPRGSDVSQRGWWRQRTRPRKKKA